MASGYPAAGGGGGRGPEFYGGMGIPGRSMLQNGGVVPNNTNRNPFTLPLPSPYITTTTPTNLQQQIFLDQTTPPEPDPEPVQPTNPVHDRKKHPRRVPTPPANIPAAEQQHEPGGAQQPPHAPFGEAETHDDGGPVSDFRVFLLGLKKPKLEAQQKQEDDVTSVKFLFSSSRKGTKTTPVSKEGVQRYLKKVKPLYVKVSKLRSSISGAGDGEVVVVEKQVGLGKSRSVSVSSPAAGETVAGGWDPSTPLEGKAVVGETDMLQAMQQYALNLAAKAVDFYDVTDSTEIARFIKKVKLNPYKTFIVFPYP